MLLSKSPKSIRVVIAISVLLLFGSCSKTTIGSEENAQNRTDSIPIWLDQSKVHHISAVDKLNLLHKALNHTRIITNDSVKGNFYSTLSYRLSRTRDTSTFRQVNRFAFNLANKRKDTLKLANLHWDLASYYDNHTKHKDSAFYHFTAAENYFNNLGDMQSSGTLLMHMAWLQNKIGDYTGSNITVINAIEKIKPLHNFKDLQYCYAVLGDNAKLLNEFDRSLEYYNESLRNNEKSGGKTFVETSIKNSLGLVYQRKGDHKQAINYFSEVLALDSLPITNPQLYGRVLTNVGNSYLKTKTKNQLPKLFVKAITVQDSIGDISGKSYSTYSLAEYYLSKKDTAFALVFLNKAKALALKSSNHERLLSILRMFPRVDPVNASKHTKEYLELNDSLQLKERQIRNKFARIQFETNEFIEENENLVRQKRLWSGIAISTLIVGLMIFIIVTQRYKNQKLRFEKKQQASNNEIFKLMLVQKEKIVEAKKIEQKRISEELHDGVLGKMLGARMLLLGLNKKNTSDAISKRAQALTLLQKVEQEVRAISHELSHAAYQKIDNFIHSIEDLLLTVESASKIKINFNYAENLDYDALNGDIKINLYRIIQESIQNAVKHANCNQINLNFALNKEHLKVEIIDNGVGFSVLKGKKGIGTRNINSRIKKVNGTWKIDSKIGKGTTVSLMIPILTHNLGTNIIIERDDLQEF